MNSTELKALIGKMDSYEAKGTTLTFTEKLSLQSIIGTALHQYYVRLLNSETKQSYTRAELLDILDKRTDDVLNFRYPDYNTKEWLEEAEKKPV